MTLYRKRPIEVHAIKWTGERPFDIGYFLETHAGVGVDAQFVRQGATSPPELVVTTVDKNVVSIPVGAYLVIDSKGYPYPCDAEIFESGHEDASQPTLLERLAEHVRRNGPVVLAWDDRPTLDPYLAASEWGYDPDEQEPMVATMSGAPTLEDAIELVIT